VYEIVNGHAPVTYLINPIPDEFEPLEYTIHVKRIGTDLFEARCPELEMDDGKKGYFVIDKGYSAVTRLANLLGNKINKQVNHI